MRIVFCWSDISGYMAACWRALAACRDVEVSVLAFQIGAGEKNIAFDDQILRGLKYQLLSREDARERERVARHVVESKPDVVVISGWFNPAYRALRANPALAGAKFVLAMDTPWRGTLRQQLGRLSVGPSVRRMDHVVVAGERAWQYARRLGVPEAKILRGVYGFDAGPLEPLLDQRVAAGWPKRFLFAGRYVEEKAIDVLLDGYAQYRKQSANPWPLSCCGRGALQSQVAAAPGVEDLGFIQPDDLPRVLLEHGVFVIVSRYEPWGVVIAEAQYAGLPVICSEACGASVEMVRHHASGLLVPTEDAAALARAMLWMEPHSDDLPTMGAAAKSLATPFTAEFWARRWHQMLCEICTHKPTR